MKDNTIFKKTKFTLKIILISFFLILFKVWHLSVIERDDRVKKASSPKRRTIIQKANRGIITDRDGAPLALNRIKYNATIYYSHIRQLPYVRYIKDKNGKRVKKYVRREYIKSLSKLLSTELDLDPSDLEDEIHSKASIFAHLPYVIKENISEEKYYTLRLLERNHPGLHAEISAERYYPQGKTACDILGYMGAINQREYFKIASEIKALQRLIERYNDKEDVNFDKFEDIESVKDRLKNLKMLSYSATDLVGKAGIEKILDEDLKGFHVKKTFQVDIKGNFLKELGYHKKPRSGKRTTLTISTKLQSFCEKLLLEDELARTGDSKIYSKKDKAKISQKQPFQKGGAIVVMDPNTFEILALASNPRFDPNDFIPSSNKEIRERKQKNIHKWLETNNHIASIFDGREKLQKELFNKTFSKEEKELTLDLFLEFILPINSSIKTSLDIIKNVNTAILLQEDVEVLKYFAKTTDALSIFNVLFKENRPFNDTEEEISKNLIESSSSISQNKRRVTSYLKNISNNKDKLFTVDILRLIVFSPAFSDELIEKVKNLSLQDYWKLSKSVLRIKSHLKKEIKPFYHDYFFTKWRESNEKSFLLSKRKIEKEKKRFAKPYIDYLNAEESRIYNLFWKKNETIFLTYLLKNSSLKSKDLSSYFDYLKSLNKTSFLDDFTLLKKHLDPLDENLSYFFIKTIRSFNDLDRPLLHKYRKIKNSKGAFLEKHLAKSFYPLNGFGYSKSYCITNASPPGSIFKLIPAYTALKERYNYLKKNNYSLKRLNPFSMIDDIYWDAKVKRMGSLVVGTTLDGKPYPRIYKKGRLPKSAHGKIGKVDLISAIERSSNPYFSILSSDCISSPYSLINVAKSFNIGHRTNIDLLAESSGNLPDDILFNKTSLYSFAIGQHSLVVTPLQTAVMLSAIANGGNVYKPKLIKTDDSELKNKIFMPKEIRNMLLEGLDRVVSSDKGSARANIIKKLLLNRSLFDEYKSLTHQFVGKTSTAEFMYNPSLAPSSKAEKYNNIWFATISFKNPKKPINSYNKQKLWDKPELVVVVELNYGSSGKEAAPIAMQIIKKYRELNEKEPEVTSGSFNL